MSLFGKIMAVIFMIWSFISLMMLSASTSGDLLSNPAFGTVVIGYTIIIAVTVVLKLIVNAL